MAAKTSTKQMRLLEAVEADDPPVLMPCKCKKPSIQTMDYLKFSPDDWNNPEHRINRVCLKCWAHWFGPSDTVKFYTKKEWDFYIEAST